MTDSWFYAQGSLGRDGWESVVDSSLPGWHYTGLRVAVMAPGREVRLPAGATERLIVPLAGSFTVRYQRAGEARSFARELAGRASVFHGPTDSLYLPSGTSLTITGSGRVAVAGAVTSEVYPVAYLPASEVPIELRGAGRATHQVHNFGMPSSLQADRLIVCEVITPAENWSSYPPHKHDEYRPGAEGRLEEIYYFETAVTRGQSAPPAADPFGYFRNYASSVGDVDTNEEVRSGDIALVPYGWHGPCVAAPGYDLYSLNVMAGPDPERVWEISEDPSHSWIRDTWAEQSLDPRLPYRSHSD